MREVLDWSDVVNIPCRVSGCKSEAKKREEGQRNEFRRKDASKQIDRLTPGIMRGEVKAPEVLARTQSTKGKGNRSAATRKRERERATHIEHELTPIRQRCSKRRPTESPTQYR